MSDLIGKSLGRYHILEQLGEGGMATVFKAYDTRLETDVAVKVIRTENLPQNAVERALKRFEREAKALARLTHPNIVKVTDYGEFEDKPYLVMPYLPGGTLKQKLGKSTPWQEAIRLLLPIAEALAYAHSHNMIHRDVKPSNILLAERGQPMLSDFGIAKLLDMEETVDLTGTSAAIGTPEYMAPEQASAKTVDHRADIYALGVVLYEMVTGRKPFIADTPLAVLIMHTHDPLPSPKNYVPGLPDGVEKVLLKALAKRPEDRYQSMDEMVRGLEKLLGLGNPSVEKKSKEKHEAAEKPGEQKLQLENAEKARRERAERRAGQIAARKEIVAKTFVSWRSKIAKAPSIVKIAGFAGVTIVVLWIASLAIAKSIAPVPTAQNTVLQKSSPLVFSGRSGSDFNIYAYDAAYKTISPMIAGGGKNWDADIDTNGIIYFTSNRDGKAEIYRRLTNGKIERVTSTPKGFSSWGATIDSIGNIYFTSNRDGKAEIYRRLTNGKTERVTRTTGRFESWGAAIDSAGNVYFTSNRDGKAEIYRRLTNGKTERVTHTPEQYESWEAAIDAAGNVYFTSNRDGKAEIYCRRTDGTTERLTDTPGKYESWGVVLRGQDIYFTSNQSTRNEVYILNPAVTNVSHMVSWTKLLNEKLQDINNY